MKSELKQAIADYEHGLIVFDELRSFLLARTEPDELENVIRAIPQDAAVRLVQWTNRYGLANLPAEFRIGKAEQLPPAFNKETIRVLGARVEAASSTMQELDLDGAAANVRTDVFGDWYRDPWGWPELGYLAGPGKHHVHARLMQGPSGHGLLLDVPKGPNASRPGVVMDVLDRLIYQAAADAISPRISKDLPKWVYGWRKPFGRSTSRDYARNDYQWLNYKSRIGTEAYRRDLGYRADVASFFESLTREHIETAVSRYAGPFVATLIMQTIERLHAKTGRKGLPQRSSASCVIANGLLAPLDRKIQARVGAANSEVAAVRWVDDFWIFGEESSLRPVETEIQESVGCLGLSLNPDKTRELRGSELKAVVDRLDLGYVEAEAKLKKTDAGALERAVAKLAKNPEQGTRHEVSYLTSTIRKRGRADLAEVFAEDPLRFDYGADRVAIMLRKVGIWHEMKGWLVRVLQSDATPWVKMSYIRMVPLDATPEKDLIDRLHGIAVDPRVETYVRIVGLARLLQWSADGAQAVATRLAKEDLDPFLRRAVGLTSAALGRSKSAVRKILLEDACGVTTAEFLESLGGGARELKILV